MMKKLYLFSILCCCAFFNTTYAQNCSNFAATAITGTAFCVDCNVWIEVVTTGGTPPYAYTWSFGTVIQPTVTELCPGIYAVTVTDANGCSTSLTTTVSDSNPPPVDIFVSQMPTCNACNGVLVAQTNGGTAMSYVWNDGSTGMTTTVCADQTYTVTVTDWNGCSATASTYVGGCNTPAITQPATCNLCNGIATFPTAQDSTTSTFYVVQGSNGFSTQFSGNILTGLCPGDYTYFSNGSPTGTISGSFVIENITLPFTADATITTSAGNGNTIQVCTGQSIQFNASESNMAVAWDFGDGTTSDLLNPTHSYNTAGTYTVTLHANGCDDSDASTLTVEVEQGIAPNITCASLSCPTAPSEVYTTDVVCDTYNWSVVGGTITAGQNSNTITVAWNDTPMGTVNLTVGDCDGSTVCNPVGSISVPLMSNNIIIEGNNIVCQNTTHIYSVPVYGGVAYEWSIVPSNAGTIVWQDNNQIAIQWNSTDATVSVAMSSDLVDCTATNDLAVEVNLTYDISGNDELCSGQTATYTATAGAHNWTVTGDATIIGNANNTGSVVVQAGSSNFVVSASPNNTTQYCDFPQTIAVSVAPPPLSPQVSGENIVCPDHVYSYNIVGAASGLSYQWNIVGGTPATASGNAVSIIWDNSATHSISVVAQSNAAPYCSSPPSSFAVNTLQSVAITGDDELCSGETATYTALPLLPDIDYNWTITPIEAGSVISGQGNNVVQVQWYNNYPNATLHLSVCNATDALPVIIHTATTPTITQNTNLCEGGSVSLSVSPNTYSQYNWSGGQNGSIITASNGGSYVVTITDANGCTANTTYQLHEFPLPNASISLQDHPIICVENPNNVAISALESPGYTYQWSENAFPLSETSNTYVHIGNDQGSVFVYQATITDANGCVNVSNPVTIQQVECVFVCNGNCNNPSSGGGPSCTVAANATIGFDPIIPHCNTVEFTNSSVGANSFQWDFGDGSLLQWAGTNSNQTHNYNDAGFYQVYLNGFYPNLFPPPAECLARAVRTVEIPLQADFDYVSPCINTATEFTDRSQHTDNTSITSWQWDFGDGQSSTDQNPSHTYSAEGTYTVSLTIDNGNCSHSTTQNIIIHPLPNVGFSTVGLICENTPTSLVVTNPSPDNINWEWDFGDNSSVSSEQGNHTYVQDGMYAVTLSLTDIYGCVHTATQTIEALPIVVGNIAATDLNACVGETVTLNAPSASAYLWSDSNNSNTASIAVGTSGGYVVTVTQDNGCTYKTPEVAVNFAPAPAASITPVGTLQICPNSSIDLFANQGTDLVYTWSNGTNGSSINVQHSQLTTAGTNFTVTITDTQSGCSAVSNTVLVQAAQLANPTIAPTGVIHLCEGESQSLSASHPTLNDFSWNTGDATATITANASGNYVVSVTDANGCITTAQTTISINDGMNMAAIPTGCYEYCENDPPIVVPATFSSYTWIKDGQFYSSGNSLVPTVTGNYQLVVGNNWGCTDSSQVLALEIIDCVDCNCTAAFTYTIQCLSLSLTATSIGNGSINHVWNFGDGTANSNLPNHTYSTAGTYEVCLTSLNTAADGDTCSSSICQTIVVNAATASISGDNSFCEGQSSVLTASSGSSYQWSTNETTASISVTTADTYTVTVTDSNGCSATATTEVSLNPNPIPTIAGENTFCEGQSSVLTASSGSSYQWSTNETTASISITTSDTYTVTVTDSNGCSASSSIAINSVPTLATPELMCSVISDTELLLTWNEVVGAVSYTITHNGETMSVNAPQTSYTFTNLEAGSTHDIGVSAMNNSSCNSATATTNCSTTLTIDCATIAASVTLQSLPISPVVIAENLSVTAVTTNLSEPLNYAWTADGEAVLCEMPCDTYSEMISKPTVYAVTVTDANGCTASATLLVDVIMPNKVIIPNAFSPNNAEPNNIFRIAAYNVAEYRLWVYDRFGNKVYDSGQTTDMQTGWDGTYNDKNAELSVYAYFAEVLFINGDRQFLKGNVTLIR